MCQEAKKKKRFFFFFFTKCPHSRKTGSLEKSTLHHEASSSVAMLHF